MSAQRVYNSSAEHLQEHTSIKQHNCTTNVFSSWSHVDHDHLIKNLLANGEGLKERLAQVGINAMIEEGVV